MTQSPAETEKAAQPAPAPAAEEKTPEKAADTTANGMANGTANGTVTGGSEVVEGETKPKEDPPKTTTEDVSKEPAAEDKKEEKKDGDKPKDEADGQKADEKVDEKEAEKAKPAYLANNKPLSDLCDALPSVIEKTGHSEMWGVQLKDRDDPPTVIILMKYLRANDGDAKAASEQLTNSLEWRKKMDPLALAEATFPASKFKDLGFVTTYEDEKNGRAVFTWNVYGSVKDIKKTFGDVNEFIKWRVALMELAVRDLKIGAATSVMDYNGEDPYQMFQVHDYGNVSFLRMDPAIRKSSRETIEKFSMAYPELLKGKYFVNVPAIMGWVFNALKVLLSKATIRKFHPMSNGASLAGELDAFGSEVPKEYGGDGKPLAEQGRTPALKVEPADEAPAATEPEPSKDKSSQKNAEEAPAAGSEATKSKETAPAPAENAAPAEKVVSAEKNAPAENGAPTEAPAPAAAASAEPAKGEIAETAAAK